MIRWSQVRKHLSGEAQRDRELARKVPMWSAEDEERLRERVLRAQESRR